jgi:hypothetical protein
MSALTIQHRLITKKIGRMMGDGLIVPIQLEKALLRSQCPQWIGRRRAASWDEDRYQSTQHEEQLCDERRRCLAAIE